MSGISTYNTTERGGLGGASLEADVLIKCASELNYIKEHWENEKRNLNPILEKNRKIWTILSTSLHDETNDQPQEVVDNIAQLTLFVFQRTLEIMFKPEPEKLKILIDINLNIAQGLNSHG